MGQPIVQNFIVQSDTSGANTFKDSMRGISEETEKVGKATETTAPKVDGLLRRVERPLGRTLYAALAADALGLGEGTEKASGATMALERGFHSVAIAATFMGGEFASLVLIGSSLVALLFKLADGSKLTEEGVKKETDAHHARMKLIQEAIPILQKAGDLSEEDAARLKKANANEQEAINILKDKIQQQENALHAEAKINEERAKGGAMDAAANIARGRLQVIDERLNDLAQVRLGLLELDKDKEKERNDALEKQANYLAAVAAAQDQLDISAMNLKETQAKEAETLKIINDLEEDLAKATTPEMLAAVQAKIAGLNAYDAMLKKHELQLKAAAKNEGDFSKTMEALGEHLRRSSADTWNDIISGNQKKFDEDVQNFAHMAAQELFIDATKNLFMDPLLAAGEFAASAALSLLAGKSPSAGGAEEAKTPSGGGGGRGGDGGKQGNNIGLTVVLQGAHVTDPNFAAYVGQAINNYTQNLNGQIISTHYVNSSGNTVPIGKV